jgi:TonB-linked SusC/RagA family outer membrane protein
MGNHLFTAVFMFAFCIHVAGKTVSQTITLSAKGMPVQQVFDEVRRQTHYSIFYDKAMLTEAKPVTVDVKDKPIADFFDLVMEGQPFGYYIEHQTIFIKRKDPVIRQASLTSVREPVVVAFPIQGTIVGADGSPLPYVNIVVKGTTRGTTSDADGKFRLDVNNGDVLVVSSIGFVTQEVTVNSESPITITLAGESTSLNEVVVTALGIRREERSLTYSVQTVKGDQLSKAKETNVVNSLQGKVAGVTITKDATGPGGDSKVLIRGNRSINNSNEPLYVIDGVPLNGNVGMLSSDDIESMTVLKGASAAALYGSQGQNGAIIITTKRGKAGETTVGYVGGWNIDQAAVLPDLQFEYGQGDAGEYKASSEHSWGPKITGQEVELWNGSKVKMEGQPDRLKNFFRNGNTFNNTVSLQGGTDKAQVYFSYGNMLARGIMPNNNLVRHNLDLKISSDISKKLSFFSKLTYIYDNVDNRVIPGDGGTYALPSIFRSPVTIPLSEMQQYSYLDETGTEKQSYWNPGSSVQLNPYWALNRVLYWQKRERIIALASLKYTFTDWLNLQVRGSFDRTIQNNDHKVFADSYFSQVGSDYQRWGSKRFGSNMDALLSFNHDIGEKFNITGNIGASLQETRYESNREEANGLVKPNYFFLINAKSPVATNSFGRTPRVQSLYATATLSYNNYLYLDVTARNDWSSALPKQNRSYFYPSIGLSAIVSDMISMPSWVTYGRARITSASSGYGGIEYLDRNYYSVGAGGAIITPTIKTLGDYKPELTHSYEFGLDWRFFNSRLGFNATYYNTRTKDQLLTIGIPDATLFRQKYINAGLIENKGIELTADYSPVKTRDLVWTVGLNYSKNKNKVIELTENMKSVIIGEGDNVYLIKVNEGSSYGDVYVRGWAKNDQGQRVVDSDGMPIFTDGLDAFVGNYNPDYMMGISNTLSYKDFSLSFLIDHRQGGVVISGTQALIDADGHSKASLQGREGGIVLDGVTQDGAKNTVAVDAQKYFGTIGGRYPIAEFYSYSGTNTRLREVVLSYRLPAGFLSKTKIIKKAEVSLVGRNLFFFHKVAPIDPEITRGVNGGGLEYAALPSTRSYGLNLNVSF